MKMAVGQKRNQLYPRISDNLPWADKLCHIKKLTGQILMSYGWLYVTWKYCMFAFGLFIKKI